MTSTHSSFTGSIPEDYDRYLGPLLFEFTAADMAQRVANAISGPSKLLEVACGTGISTRHLAGTVPEGTEIFATDLNEAMLAHAEKVNGALPGVRYSEADALDLPFGDNSFDAVVCQFGIMFFPDKNRGMREMFRVLRPGGVLALNVWNGFDRNPSVGVIDTVIKSFFDTDPPRFLEIPFGGVKPGDGRILFEEAGFKEINISTISEQIETEDHSLPARGFITGNPTIIEVQNRATVDAEEIVDAASDALQKSFGPAPVKLNFEATVFLAQKPKL